MADKHRFSYSLMKNARDEAALRPMLPLTLTYHGHSLRASGLLDSGADVNVLPYGLGLELSAVWSEQATAVQLSGNLANYEARGLVLRAAVEDLPPVQLAFAWTQTEHVPLLLGQVNFFMEFNVCFYRAQQAFDISPRDHP